MKGHEWLVNHGHVEFQEMRFDERDLSDQQMADLVLESNKVRKDLNPIEEAQFYARYIKDFNVTETELAAKHNVSQGEVANTIRLLELPDNVKGQLFLRKYPLPTAASCSGSIRCRNCKTNSWKQSLKITGPYPA